MPTSIAPATSNALASEPLVAHATDTAEAYRRFGPALVRKAERILLSSDDARDIVHGVFVELIRKRATAELPYLYRAVTTRCLNFLRDTGNRRRLLDQQTPALRGPVRTRCDERVITLDVLDKLMDRLSQKHMDVVVCLFIDDMSQDQTARVLGVSRKTIGKRLAAIREKLRTLADNGAEERLA